MDQGALAVNVTALPGKILTAAQRGAEPNEEVIGYLRALLVEAEAGRLQAIGYAYVDHQGEVCMREVAASIGDARDVMSGLVLLTQAIANMINSASLE